MLDKGPSGTVVGMGDHNHNNRSYTIRITKTGHIQTRNSKCIKTTLIIAELYFRDQLTQQTEDALDKILKQYEMLSPYNVPNNTTNRRREETYRNNYSDMQTSNTQGHNISNVPNNGKHTGIIE